MPAQIYLQGGMNNGFIIPLNGLATGKNEFSWKVGKEFFENFGNSEILDAEIDVQVTVEKSGRYVGVDCEAFGDVVVECDRCLDELELPVEVEILLSVKYGEEESSEEPHPGEREVIFVPETEAELDMSQIIYDYVCLSLPLQRVHDEGECNPEAIRHLNAEVVATDKDEANNPFASLKSLLG